MKGVELPYRGSDKKALYADRNNDFEQTDKAKGGE